MAPVSMSAEELANRMGLGGGSGGRGSGSGDMKPTILALITLAITMAAVWWRPVALVENPPVRRGRDHLDCRGYR